MHRRPERGQGRGAERAELVAELLGEDHVEAAQRRRGLRHLALVAADHRLEGRDLRLGQQMGQGMGIAMRLAAAEHRDAHQAYPAGMTMASSSQMIRVSAR